MPAPARYPLAMMQEMEYQRIVEAAGGRYVGVVFGRVSFHNSHGSTVSLLPGELTIERVRATIAESDAQFSNTELHPLLRKFQKG